MKGFCVRSKEGGVTQFKVPQNIDMADRIVGPLTLIQFLYVLVGGIIVYFLFSTIAPVNGSLFLLLAAPITLFSLAMAFLKVQDQPFPKFVAAFFVFLIRPKVRMWHKEGMELGFKIVPDKKKAGDDIVEPKKIKKSELESLIQVMDTGGKAGDRPGAVVPKTAVVSPSLKQPSKPVPAHKIKQVSHGQK